MVRNLRLRQTTPFYPYYYLNLIKKIEDNEKRVIEEALTVLKDISEYQN